MHSDLDRRRFLEQTAAAVTGVAALGSAGEAGAVSAAVAPVRPTVARIGLQLYTISDKTREDMDQALESVSAVGYKVVEFAGYNSIAPEKIRATLDRLKMTSPSTHISLASLRNDFETQVHVAEVLGHEYITVPSFGNDTPYTLDAWKKAADEFNAIGAKLKARRIRLAFHSHRDEFNDVGGGKKGMDIFIGNTDPALVAFELDLGWARVAGEDPVAWFRRYPGRFTMWHVKDILALAAARERQVEQFKTMAQRASAPPAVAAAVASPPPANAGGTAAPAVTGGPVPVGAGEIDYKPILAQWKIAGLEHFFVEQDGAANWPGGALVAIATSYRNLVNLMT
jgi:sugar phosphate isomerase/epimerase